MGKDCNRRGFRSTNFLYVVILCLLLSPATGFAQTKRINLELKNVTVQEAVTSLNRTENYSILVSSDEVDLNKRISVSAQNATIREILDQVFAGQEVIARSTETASSSPSGNPRPWPKRRPPRTTPYTAE